MSRIFDYQRFYRNRDLQKLINETDERCESVYEGSLSDDSLALVAGGKKNETEEKEKEKA